VTQGGTRWEELKPTEMAESKRWRIHFFNETTWFSQLKIFPGFIPTQIEHTIAPGGKTTGDAIAC